ncbi:MAG TPA: S8 family serine peptidase [Dehalococcoidia bacterium]|nr:S8 family serine peptidase [Dehalococcoidia bacterium]
MKSLKLLALVLIVVSVFGIWPGALGDCPANGSMSVRGPVPTSPATLPTYPRSPFEPEGTKNNVLDDTSLSQFSSPAVWQEQTLPNDPFLKQQWALTKIKAPVLWRVTTGVRGGLVAVLDTGIDQDHEDLVGNVVAEVNFTDSPTCRDVYGHGTHVAGIIAARCNNEIGIAGVAPESQLMNVKVADDRGECRAIAVASGIMWAVEHGASVINISLELAEPSVELENAINYAWSQGAVVIAAAGNDGSVLPAYPARYKNSIAVAAIRQDDTLAPLSNHGYWLDVAAPGFNIYSLLPGDKYGYKSGTSFAAAYVSGLAAQFYGIVTDRNGDNRINDEVREIIETGCQEIGLTGTGKGCIDAANSLANIDHDR